MDVERYLASERRAKTRHERWRGRVYAMADASFEHSVIVGNVTRLLGELVIDRPCAVLASAMKVHIPAVDAHVYPDLSVVCGAPVFVGEERDVIANPRVIVEVASELTECFDRGDKFVGYRSLACLVDYLLVVESRVRVEHYRCTDGAWVLRVLEAGSRLGLAGVDGVIDVDAVYRAHCARSDS